MLVEYATDYINIGKDINHRQNLLNIACTAWNISILPENSQKEAIEDYIENHIKLNQHFTDENIQGLKKDLELLVEQKLSMFPSVKKVIMGASIIEDEGKETILAASVRQK